VDLVGRLKRTESPALRYALLRAAGAFRYATHGHLVRAARTRRYLATTPEPGLQVGAGPTRLPGWLNSDLISGDIQLDVGRRLPLPDASFSYAFGEHLIEHMAPATGELMMSELRRVLRPGGVLRLTTPDLKKVIAIYEDRNPEISRDDYSQYLGGLTGKQYDQPCEVLNDYLRLWGHRYVYDEEDLTARLLAAGFAEVVRVQPGESVHERLRGVERHGGAEWINRAEAMCLEATRPTDAAA
jgi:predicted SAM-dependent methyltransferase